MNRTTLICLLGLLLVACKKEKQEDELPKNYILVEQEGIFVESFADSITDPNRYTANNEVYKDGRSFRYSFKHKTAGNKIQYFKKLIDDTGSLPGWTFIDSDKKDSTTVEEVIIKVKYGLEPFIQHMPDYNQTLVSYDYPIEAKERNYGSISGAIENEKNVWIHPPRDMYFEILELNPFPFIMAPYEVGTSWTWSLGIGDIWSDPRWMSWEGGIENQYQYQIVDQKKVETSLGKLECFIVEATAESRLGTTGLRALFNEDFGFVRLTYSNIDESKTILELIEVIEPESIN